jgi:hypothetical protein
MKYKSNLYATGYYISFDENVDEFTPFISLDEKLYYRVDMLLYSLKWLNAI